MTQSVAKPGAALRAFREKMGWTLANVSQKTGLRISTISKIERNQISLNIDKLSRLSAGLGIDIAHLLDARATSAGTAGRRSVTRADDCKVIETAMYKHLYHSTDLLNKKFLPLVADIKARSIAEFGELIRHAGEEFALVLEGVVVVHTDQYAPVTLHVGDSIYFSSEMGHAYIAGDSGPCRLLSISSDLSQDRASEALFVSNGHNVEVSRAPMKKAAKTNGSREHVEATRFRRARKESK